MKHPSPEEITETFVLQCDTDAAMVHELIRRIASAITIRHNETGAIITISFNDNSSLYMMNATGKDKTLTIVVPAHERDLFEKEVICGKLDS